ncbi:MAG TPA: hypothetical protein VHF86_02915, partial [Xanthomonadaceae bacterium]|nr:hypothetical protein [Xanthomonadaceae bacterium]
MLAAVTAAFFLGRWSREPTTLAAAVHDAADEGRNGIEDATRAATPSAASTPKAATSNRAPSGSGARPQLPNVPVSARASGPQPLLPEDAPHLDKAERMMGADGGTTRDLLDLARD